MAITLSGNGTSTFSNNITSATGDLTLGDGNLVVADGHGIDFSAAGNAAGMTSELLDDYEEGAFTPTLTGDPSYSLQAGRYTKIGNRVYFNLFIQVSSAPTATTLSVLNLPFVSGLSDQAFVGYGRCWNNNWVSQANNVQWLQQPNTSIIGAYTTPASGSTVQLNTNSLGTNGNLMISGHYYVD